MAIKKIKINGTSVDVHDVRILGIDSTPTASSTNVVESGGVYTELSTKLDYVSGDVGEDYDTTELDNRVAYTSQTKTTAQKAAARGNIDAENVNNKVTSLSSSSTDTQYPSAKCVYNELEDKQDTLTIDTSVTNTSTNVVQSKAITDYIVSRGENLCTNGFASLKSNYNFSDLTYDSSDTYGAAGSFYKDSSKLGSTLTSELMPVDITQSYRLSYAVKNTYSTSTYDYIYMYDVDGLVINGGNVSFTNGTTTTLAQDLHDGDTVVYFTDLSGWNTESTSKYIRGLIFWNYRNSGGYQYPIEYYSRNWWYELWDDSSIAIDKTNNTITLKSAWNHGTFEAGVSVSQSAPSGANVYGNVNYFPTAGEWVQKSYVFTPNKFRNATAYVRIGWLYNYTKVANNRFALSSVSLTQNASLSDI